MSEARADLPPAASAMGLKTGLPPPSGGNVALPQPNVQPSNADLYDQAVIASGQTPTPVQGGQLPLRDQVKAKWVAAGATPQAAEGIAQAIQGESGFNPTEVGDNNTSFGLYQHHNDRAVRLFNFAQSQGKSPADPLVQTDFAIKEALTGGDQIAAQHRDLFMKASDPNAARQAFSSYFERPAAPTHAGGSDRPLPQVMFGDLTGGAKQLADLAITRLDRADAAYQRAMAQADDIHAMARAREARLEALESKPPQNMHDAWNTWGGVAGLLALFGGFIGRGHATAALGAAGEMMQAANQADEFNYDRSYKIWKDQAAMADRAIGRFNEDANAIISSADKSYDHQLAELETLSKIYQLPQTITHQQIEQQTDQLRLANERRKYIEGANEDSDIRNGAYERLVKDHPEYANTPREQMPAYLWNKYYGEEREARKGTESYLKFQYGLANYQSWLQSPEGQAASPQERDQKAALYGLVNPAAVRIESDPRFQAAKAFADDIQAKTGKPPTYEDWVKFSQSTKGSATGQLSPDAVKLAAKQYEMGDPGIITSMPRSGPARIQIDNQVAEDMKDLPDAAQQIVMNRIRMAEARSAATTAGRVTMNTELYAQEAVGAGKLVIEASKKFPRTDYPTVNQIWTAYNTQTGDPRIIEFGTQLFALYNAYGKLSNPTGVGIHDADKARLDGVLSKYLAQGQIEAAVDAIILDGKNVSSAARNAQVEVLAGLAPKVPGAQPETQQRGTAVPVPAEHANDPDGTTYNNGAYVKRGNQMVPQ